MAKKAAKKKAATKTKCGGGEVLVVASKVRAYVKSKGCMMSSELIGALNCKIHCLIDQAVCRTKANKRSTVKAQDV